MTNTEKFSELAEQGGYKFDSSNQYCEGHTEDHVLLDPSAWQAVGKVKMWDAFTAEDSKTKRWHIKWILFIDLLVAGKDIDSALEDILQ